MGHAEAHLLSATILVARSHTKCPPMKPQKPSRYRAGVAAARAEPGSGAESDSDESVPELQEQLPHRQPHKEPSRQQQLRSMNQPVNKTEPEWKEGRRGCVQTGSSTGYKGYRVAFQKSKNVLFVITKPDVYKSPASDTHIEFGIYLVQHS